MSTNHVQELASDHGLYAFFLNDKGRILADASIYNLGESLFLDTEPETKDKLFQHLDRFIIADDVTLEDETESMAAIGLEGPKSLEIAQQLGIPFGQGKASAAVFHEGFTARVSVTGAEGVRMFIPVSAKQELIDRLNEASVPAASPEEARVVRLEIGHPRYGEEISERYLVQETQVADAVHYNKGCYLGQELWNGFVPEGRCTVLLTPVRIEGTIPPAPGTKLKADGADVAEISSAAFSPALGLVVGLAYVRTEATHAKPVMIVAGTEPAVTAFIP